MEEGDKRIVAGAQYEGIDGEQIRVKSLWVDEDLTTNIQISHLGESRSVSLEEFASLIGPTVASGLARINDDHDARKWRQNR